MPFMVREGGVRVDWELDGVPGNPTLLLLHSASVDLSIWDSMISRLAGHFYILRIDLRGHGASDVSIDSSTTMRLARDVLAVLDASGVSRTTVAGVGLGGRIAIDLALLAPECVQALALICTSARDPALPDRLSEIACPTLVISGRKDQIAPFETNGSVIANGIVGARTAIIDCGHLPPLEAPVALASQMELFFLKPPTVSAAEELLYQSGLVNRRRVLGDDYVDESLARRTPFNAEFQAMITRIAWHEIYSRPGLDLRTRRLVVLAVTAAMARWEEFRLHLRAAVTTGGVSRDEIKELLMQLAIYAGVPAANTGFAEAAALFAVLDREDS